MSTTDKHTEPSSADIDAELTSILADLDAETAALAAWDEANADGQEVNYSEKGKRRSLIEVLRDRRRNAEARKIKAERRERLQQLADLRAQIEAEETDEAERILATGVATMAAMRGFLADCKARDERLRGHQLELAALNVPEHAAAAETPSPEHGHLGWTPGGQLAVGADRLSVVNGPALLERMVGAALAESTGAFDAAGALARVEAELAGLHTTVQPPAKDARFFQGGGGGIFVFGPDGPPENVSVREITLAEANHAWWQTNDARAKTALSTPIA